MRALHLHCGLHKTGTTALQAALSSASGALRSHGILYPRSGTPEGTLAQHNLAWEMTRDRRFAPEHGGIGALLVEIEAFEGRVVLSSEDFEGALLRPALWRSLLDQTAQAGYAPTLVVYLREPVAYLESLYVETLKHGYGGEYLLAAQVVLEHGVLTFADWVFCFDYPRIARALGSLDGVATVFRDYGNLVGGDVLADFSRVLGLDPSILGTGESGDVNARDDAATSLALFARNRGWNWHDWNAPRALMQAAAFLCADWRIRLETSTALRDALRARLPSHAGLLDEPHFSQDATTRADDSGRSPATVQRVDIARFFSEETFLTLRQVAATVQGQGDRCAAWGRAMDLRSRWRERVSGRDTA